jgi:hypothetical protein
MDFENLGTLDGDKPEIDRLDILNETYELQGGKNKI